MTCSNRYKPDYPLEESKMCFWNYFEKFGLNPKPPLFCHFVHNDCTLYNQPQCKMANWAVSLNFQRYLDFWPDLHFKRTFFVLTRCSVENWCKYKSERWTRASYACLRTLCVFAYLYLSLCIVMGGQIPIANLARQLRLLAHTCARQRVNFSGALYTMTEHWNPTAKN